METVRRGQIMALHTASTSACTSRSEACIDSSVHVSQSSRDISEHDTISMSRCHDSSNLFGQAAFALASSRSTSVYFCSILPCAGHLPDVLRKIKVNKTLKGILFDVDGTLTHSDDLHYKAFVDILQKERFQGVPTAD